MKPAVVKQYICFRLTGAFPATVSVVRLLLVVSRQTHRKQGIRSFNTTRYIFSYSPGRIQDLSQGLAKNAIGVANFYIVSECGKV